MTSRFFGPNSHNAIGVRALLKWKAMFNIIGLGISLTCFWLLMSGHYTPFILSLGGVSVLLVLYLTRRMDFFDKDTFQFSMKWKYLSYWIWLGKEIFNSNIAVAKVVLSPRLDISPRMIEFKSSQKTELGLVIFANSITLTPGTVSVDIEDDKIIVHALNAELPEGVLNGEMDSKVTALEVL